MSSRDVRIVCPRAKEPRYNTTPDRSETRHQITWHKAKDETNTHSFYFKHYSIWRIFNEMLAYVQCTICSFATCRPLNLQQLDINANEVRKTINNACAMYGSHASLHQYYGHTTLFSHRRSVYCPSDLNTFNSFKNLKASFQVVRIIYVPNWLWWCIV
jgi:hypothetical protein